MYPELQEAILAAGAGLAAWFITDFLFGTFRRRADLERDEWEYRLKEIYCPLYYWTGRLITEHPESERAKVVDAMHQPLSRAAYVVPKEHFETLVAAVGRSEVREALQSPPPNLEATRQLLYAHIEALNLLLYRLEDAGGVGDPRNRLEPYKRALRVLVLTLTQVLAWAVVALALGAAFMFAIAAAPAALAATAVVALLVLWVDVRQRDAVRKGIRERLETKGGPTASGAKQLTPIRPPPVKSA